MWANSANKFFDSLASGTAIAINYKGWQEEIINTNNIGVVLSPSVTDETCFQFLELFENPETLRIKGENAKGVARKYFDREILAKELNDILVGVLEYS